MSRVNAPVIQAADAKTLNSLHKALDSVARERRWLALAEAPPLAAVVAFADILARQGCPQLVALDGKRVVGWCDIRVHEGALSRHVGVLGMGVVDGYRGRGIGRALLEACLAKSPFARVELSVFADNTAAIKLYEKTGFVHEGVRRRAIRLEGDRDLVLMARLVEGP